MPGAGTLEAAKEPEGDLELQCKTCLSFDIAKSPEQGWSPADVDQLLDHELEGRIQGHLAWPQEAQVELDRLSEAGCHL